MKERAGVEDMLLRYADGEIKNAAFICEAALYLNDRKKMKKALAKNAADAFFKYPNDVDIGYQEEKEA